MKCPVVVVIALFALVAADDDWKPAETEVLRQIHEDCSRESGLTPEQVQAILNKERPDEDEVHAYVLCGVKTLGVFSEDKGFNLDRIIAQFDTIFYGVENVRHMFAACIDNNEEGSSPAVWAYRGQKCMMQSQLAQILRARRRPERFNMRLKHK